MTEYINIRLTRKVYDKLRKFEKKHKLEKSISKTTTLLLEHAESYRKGAA